MAFQTLKDVEDYRQVDPNPMLSQSVPYFSPFHMNIGWESNNLISNDINLKSRKRPLSDYDLTAGFKKLKLSLQNNLQTTTDVPSFDMMDESCNVHEIEGPRLYVDDSYLDMTNKIPSIMLRPAPSLEIEYLNSRQVVLYKPFIWRRLFDELFKILEKQEFDDSMECGGNFYTASQYFKDESMEACEEAYYGEPMETD